MHPFIPVNHARLAHDSNEGREEKGVGVEHRTGSSLERRWSAVLAGVILCGAGGPARGADLIDFARDIQPVLRENCLECHGPTKQKGGLRLDRKSSATKAFTRRIVPGNSANSMVYQRLVGVEYGTQMPPTAQLGAETIALVKTWIEQGAGWPEALSNEQDPDPLNPHAVALVDALQRGDREAFLQSVQRAPALLNERGPTDGVRR